MVHSSVMEAVGIFWRCFWLGWTWFWSGVGLFVIGAGITSGSWEIPVMGVVGMAGLVAALRIGWLVTSAMRGVQPNPL